MKKVFLVILAFAFLIACKSEKSPQQKHLEFEGISIAGNGDAFIKELERRGFEYREEYIFLSSQTYTIPHYKGRFLGVDDCEVDPVFTNSGTLWRVAVDMPREENKDTAEARFNRYYYHLVQLFGEPLPEKASTYSDRHLDWELEQGKIALVLDSNKAYTSIEVDGKPLFEPEYRVYCWYDDAEGESVFNQEKQEERIDNMKKGIH